MALLGVLDEAEAVIDAEVAKVARQADLTGDPTAVREQALDLLAERVAGMRRRNTVLTHLRSAQQYRVPAARVLLHTFATGSPPRGAAVTGEEVERGLGLLPRGRLDRPEPDVEPWHDGNPADLDVMAAVWSLPALRASVTAATDEDLSFVRRAVQPLTTGLQLISKLTTPLYGGDNFAGLGAFRRQPISGFTAPMVAALVVSLQHSPFRDNLHALVEAVDKAVAQAQGLLRTLRQAPLVVLEERLRRGVPSEVRRVRRVMQELRKGPRR